VYDYESAIDDIANVATSTVLWIDPSSNYAVYNATGVSSHRSAYYTVVRVTDRQSVIHNAASYHKPHIWVNL